MDDAFPEKRYSPHESAGDEPSEEMPRSSATLESGVGVLTRGEEGEQNQISDKEETEMARPQTEPSDKPDMSLPHEIAFIALISCAQLLTQSGLAMALAPEYIIGDYFGIQGSGLLSWYAAAYSLTVGTFILPAGRLGDIYGHKKLFVIGWVVFTLGSLLAGLSVYVTPGTQASKFFNVMRALQGLGPAMLLPNAIAILGRTYQPGKRKNMAFSLFGATAPCGATLGAAFSSLLAEFAWWPWGFWILAITTAIMAGLSVVIIPTVQADPEELELTKSKTGSEMDSLWKRLDIPGTLTGVIGLVLINIAWNQAPIIGWKTPYVYVLLIIGFLFMAAFMYFEYRTPHPLIPIRNLGKEVGFVLGCIACGWASFGIWLFYLWNFLLVLRQKSPLLLSAQFSPPALSGVIAAITTGLLLHRLGPGVVMLVSMIAFCVGNILLATMPVNQTYWAQTFVSLVVMPWGMDMSFPSATIILSNSMPREHQGMAASLVTTVVNYSISLGLGFAGTVESRIRAQGGTELQGYRSAWYLGIGFAGLGIVVAVAFNAVGLRGKENEGKGEKEQEIELSA